MQWCTGHARHPAALLPAPASAVEADRELVWDGAEALRLPLAFLLRSGSQRPARAVHGCPEGAPGISEGQTEKLAFTPGQRVHRYGPAMDHRIQHAALSWRT